MAKHEIFYAICDLFNEGETVVSIDNAEQVFTAARHTLPDFSVCSGLYDPDNKTIELYVENFKQVKDENHGTEESAGTAHSQSH